VNNIVLKHGESIPAACTVIPGSAEANVYLHVKNHMLDTAKEAKKVRAKVEKASRERIDIEAKFRTKTSLMLSCCLRVGREIDVEARLRVLEDAVLTFKNMKI
jgi:hypothetical protein